MTEVLYRIMAERGWNQAELARRLRLSESYISRLLRGERRLSAALRWRLWRCFQVEVPENEEGSDAA